MFTEPTNDIYNPRNTNRIETFSNTIIKLITCRDIDRFGQNTFEANREIFEPSQYRQRTALYPLSRSESETLNCCL